MTETLLLALLAKAPKSAREARNRLRREEMAEILIKIKDISIEPFLIEDQIERLWCRNEKFLALKAWFFNPKQKKRHKKCSDFFANRQIPSFHIPSLGKAEQITFLFHSEFKKPPANKFDDKEVH